MAEAVALCIAPHTLALEAMAGQGYSAWTQGDRRVAASRSKLRTSRGWLAAAGLLAVVVALLPATAIAEECKRSDFVEVVDAAAAALRSLNARNRPDFQNRLRQLKDKRGWTQDQFLVEAEPLVRDDRIDGYDRASEELVAKIATMGQRGGNAATPDCNLLGELRGFMDELVTAQQSKWAYMFGKVDAELKK